MKLHILSLWMIRNWLKQRDHIPEITLVLISYWWYLLLKINIIPFLYQICNDRYSYMLFRYQIVQSMRYTYLWENRLVGFCKGIWWIVSKLKCTKIKLYATYLTVCKKVGYVLKLAPLKWVYIFSIKKLKWLFLLFSSF